MTTIRTKHDANNKYTLINKEALCDPNLSLEASGLWARLLSRPNDWKVMVSELQKSCNCGKDKIYRILSELIEAGYVHRSQTRGPVKENQFGKFEYTIFETKELREEFQKSLTLTENPEASNEKKSTQIKCPHIEYGTLPGFTEAENPDDTNYIDKISIEENNPPTPQRGKRGVSFSDQAIRLVRLIQKKFKQLNPKSVSPDLKNLNKELAIAQELLENIAPKMGDSLDLETAFEDAEHVILWSYTDDYWKGAIRSSKILYNKWNILLDRYRQRIQGNPEEHYKKIKIDSNRAFVETYLEKNNNEELFVTLDEKLEEVQVRTKGPDGKPNPYGIFRCSFYVEPIDFANCFVNYMGKKSQERNKKVKNDN